MKVVGKFFKVCAKKMVEFMKKMKQALILSFVIAFTIFIYEPIILYANNTSDLWFDLKSMLRPMLILFILLFVFLMLIFYIVHQISLKKKIYNLLLIVSFIIYFASYIQGNYLIGSLPLLDGSTIVWSGYTVQNIITLIIWLVIVITYIITIKIFTIEKVVNVSGKISIVIFIMLFVSMGSTCLTTKNIFLEKRSVTSTPKYYENMSIDKNLIVFLVDAVDSRKFEEIRENSKYNNMFDDFTYYKDTLSYYLFTRDSIPLILSGIPNHNENDFYTYYNKVMNKSPLINKLIENNYHIHIYDDELTWTTDKVKYATNVKQITNKIMIDKFFVHELKYVGYKYLPYAFKKFAKIENMNFNYAKATNDDAYSWDNKDNYDLITTRTIKKNKEKIFKFIHVEGAHVPFDEDAELNKISDGTYEQKISSSLKLINSYIKWLKENDVYDNTAIVITSDHGYADGEIIGRQNPILYIKGINEHHNMEISNKKISSLDFHSMLMELLDEKKTDEIFQEITDKRERKFIWYEYLKENKMVEYLQKGSAWDNSSIEKTGKKYIR